MNTLPKIGERTIVFARAIASLAEESGEVVVSDETLIGRALPLMSSVVADSEPWKYPEQALRDSLELLERLGAIEFERRKRGPRTADSSMARTIKVIREHFLWAVLALEEVAS
jgi:hypothetical protein